MRVDPDSGTFDIGGELTVHRLGFGAMSLAGPRNVDWPAHVDRATRSDVHPAVPAGDSV
jgi:hypothetical protein